MPTTPPPRPTSGAALAALFAITLIACGPKPAVQTLEPQPQTSEVAAPAPSHSHYRTTNSDTPVIGERGVVEVINAVTRASREKEMTIEGDGRLGLLAAWIAERLGEGGEPPPHQVVEFLARHLGLTESIPHFLTLGQLDDARLEQGVYESVAQFLSRQGYNRYGAVVVERNGLLVTVVVLSDRHLSLEPLPRRIEAGTSLQLRGELLHGYHSPSLAITLPDGSVQRKALSRGTVVTGAVETSAPGEYKVAVLAAGPRGQSVVANFPIYAGVPVPDRVHLDAVAGTTDATPETVGQTLLRMTNQMRQERGLDTLTLDPRLSDVALAHSQDMRTHDFVGHDSERTGSAKDRVDRAGIRSGLILENIGRGYSAEQIHRGLMDSPGHRANLLNPDITHIGIGVVAEPEAGRMAFLATEVFIRKPQRIDVTQAVDKTLDFVNHARRVRHAPALTADADLERAAAEAAAQFFESPSMSEQDVVDQASDRLRRFAGAFSRVGGLMAVVGSLEEVSRLEPALDPSARYVGIGVAQGTRSDTEPNAIAVVVLLAWPR